MIDENLSVFFNEFAVTATLENDSQIKVIFDNKSDPMNVRVEGREITATCKTKDVSNLTHKNTIIIHEKTYTIVGINLEMDGNITKLILKE